MTLAASIVVPTYRRADLLDRCLAALSAQELDPRAFEIVIADDAASSDTREQVEGWARRSQDHAGPAIRYVPVCATDGPAAARNTGWRAARGRMIAFTDDDCIPESGWLTAGLAAIDAGADAASGRLVMPVEGAPTDYERNAAMLAEAGFVTANCFCRREWLERLDGFDERFRMAWHYYRFLATLLVAAGGVLTGRRSVALGGPLAWLVLTTRFCVQRLSSTSHAPAHVIEMAVTSALIPLLSIYWRLRGAVRYRVWFL